MPGPAIYSHRHLKLLEHWSKSSNGLGANMAMTLGVGIRAPALSFLQAIKY